MNRKHWTQHKTGEEPRCSWVPISDRAHYFFIIILSINDSCNTSICLLGYIEIRGGAVVAIIGVWSLDLQLSMQSAPITTDVVSSNLDQGKVYNIMW
jgi:hypothetical protein